MGCRRIELDRWDGPDGDPIITHGHTPTTSIKFRAVIEAVAEVGFVASPYVAGLDAGSNPTYRIVSPQMLSLRALRQVPDHSLTGNALLA